MIAVTIKNRTNSLPGQSVADIFLNNQKIGTVRYYSDYVKRKQTDLIRTKMTSLVDINLTCGKYKSRVKPSDVRYFIDELLTINSVECSL